MVMVMIVFPFQLSHEITQHTRHWPKASDPHGVAVGQPLACDILRKPALNTDTFLLEEF